MSKNVKVKNATKTEINGVKFDSKLEEIAYEVLLKFGVNLEREGLKAVLVDGFYPTVEYYTKDKDNYVAQNSKKILNWTYSPDFIFEYDNKTIILEMKGNQTDLWPYKCKMFRKYLESLPDKDRYVFAVIYSKAQLLELLNILKTKKMDKQVLSKRDFDICLNKNSSKLFEDFVFGNYDLIKENITKEHDKLKKELNDMNLDPFDNERFVHIEYVLDVLKDY